MAETSFFWYDLETSAINARTGRVMQFAGQRTDMDLNPIGDPVNVLIKLTPDILPDPDSVLITGITPQMTQEGVTEKEFLETFYKDVATPGTIFAGFNTVRFDDEFVRMLNYRNFYDAYKWQWQHGRSRWDMMDVVRMTRALRPDGIEWPKDANGVAINRLELITELNGISHENAHDALNDVYATIAVAGLVRNQQPKLFEYLLDMSDKKKAAALVDTKDPFVYTSLKYSPKHEKTSVAVKIAQHPRRQAAIVYDLRFDPTEFLELSPEEIVDRWKWTDDETASARLPVKTLRYNCCPAVAPMGVLDDASKERLQLDMQVITANLATLRANPAWAKNILAALDIMDASQEKRFNSVNDVDSQLYNGFFDEHDCRLLDVVRAADPEEFSQIIDSFHDQRLKELLPLYKARNFPNDLTEEERMAWEQHRFQALMDGGADSRMSHFMHRLQELAGTVTDQDKRFLLEELQLYAESIMPIDTEL
jgi:exodeoxyribonuclease-1